MGKDVQISAVISKETSEMLERLVAATGQKKGRVVEMALLHHLRALSEIPAEYIIPPVMTLTPKSGEDLLRLLRHPRRPTPALRKLIKRRGR